MRAIYTDGQLCKADGCTFQHERGSRNRRLTSGLCPKHNMRMKTLHSRNLHLMRKYGITDSEYQVQLAAQNGKCAICGTTEPQGRGAWHIDHDHETGNLRGLLCQACNRGIGLFRDNAESLVSAVAYLQRGGVWSE